MKTFTATRRIKIETLFLFFFMLICMGALVYLSISIFYDFKDMFGKNSSLSPFSIISLALC
jgi:hypothetical protein